MKKSLLASAIMAVSSTFLAIAPSSAEAIVGAKVGYNYWHTANHGAFHTMYGQFEHFIPFVPNAGVRYSSVDDRRMKFDSYDAYGYYSLLDNGNIAFDLGAGLRRYDSGKTKGASFSDTVPMLTTELVLLEDANMSYYARADFGKNSDTSFRDIELGLRFKLMAGFNLQTGYRNYTLDLDGTRRADNKERLRGLNLGIHWAF